MYRFCKWLSLSIFLSASGLLSGGVVLIRGCVSCVRNFAYFTINNVIFSNYSMQCKNWIFKFFKNVNKTNVYCTFTFLVFNVIKIVKPF